MINLEIFNVTLITLLIYNQRKNEAIKPHTHTAEAVLAY